MKKYYISLAFCFSIILASAQRNENIKQGHNPFAKATEVNGFTAGIADFFQTDSVMKRGNTWYFHFQKKTVKAENFFQEFKELMGIRAEDTYIKYKEEIDEIGITHSRWQQYYKGVLVEGGEMLLHEKDGRLRSANGKFYNGLSLNIEPAISKEQAIIQAKAHFAGAKFLWEDTGAVSANKEMSDDSLASFTPAPFLIITHQNSLQSSPMLLAYKMDISTIQPNSSFEVWIDANDGQFLKKLTNIFDVGYDGTAETKYSGTQSIKTDYVNGKYILKDNLRKIQTLNMKNGSSYSKYDNFFDDDNTWEKEKYVKKITINSVNTNWHSFGENTNNGGKPDIYIKVIDPSGNVLYQTAAINDFLPSNNAPLIFYPVNVILPSTGNCKIEIWDEDVTTDDYIGDITFSGSTSFSSSGNSGSIELKTENNPALDIHWGMEKTYDYYDSTHTWRSYDNKGSTIKNYFNADNSVSSGMPNNAFANSKTSIMVYGWGDNVKFNPVVGLDVQGHEFTHLITGNTCKLKYENESGALNESFSDIFGTCVEYFAKPNNGNWTIGEDVVVSGTNPYLRSLSNPNIKGDPDTYLQKNYWVTNPNEDAGGVHTNSGVQNYWFYCLSHGDAGTNALGNSYNVTAVGIKNASKIAFYNLRYNLFSTAEYWDAVYGSLDAAYALYTVSSQEALSTINAWYAVGLLSSSIGFCGGTVSRTDSTAIITDGSLKGRNYQDYSDCKWLIKPSGAKTITVTFNKFDLSTSSNDTLFIYDGSSTSSTILLKATGNSLPSSVTSTTGTIFIHFSTDNTGVADGWELIYKANYTSGSNAQSYCSGKTILKKYTNTFTDGSSGNNYGNNADCEWLIAPPGADSIKLSFNSFSTESGKDYVKVYDGADATGTLLGSYSGSSTPSGLLWAKSGKMFVTFDSDNSGTSTGWSATYNAYGTVYCTDTVKLTAASASFNDGSGSANYHDNSDCKWLIQPTGAKAIILEFDSFDVEHISSDGKSIYDYVSVYDGSTTSDDLLGTFAGDQLPSQLISTQGNMLVVFHTDNRTNAGGFYAHYTSSTTALCSGTKKYTTTTGTITDGSGTGNYFKNADCRWLINPSNATSIELQFAELDLDTNDAVVIYDGASTTDKVLGVYTGSTVPTGKVISSDRYMLVRFMSNDTIEKQGFKANWTSNISSGGGGSGGSNGSVAIVAYEYWFDDGYSNHIDVKTTALEDYYLDDAFSTANLKQGLHSFHIRFVDREGQWSSVISQYFQKTPETNTNTKEITALEYWFDDNTSTTFVNQGPVADLYNDTSFNTSSLKQGLHSIHIRYQDNAGLWSSVVSQYFQKTPETNTSTKQIVALEYWFDDNTSTTFVNQGPIADLYNDTSFNTSSLKQGLHSIHIRYQDNAGLWSSVVSQYFQKTPETNTSTKEIVGLEYWFDDNASTIFVSQGPVADLYNDTSFNTSSLKQGLHSIHIRYQDNAGLWSSVVSQYFQKVFSNAVQSNDIVAYRYWYDMADSNMNNVTLASPIDPLDLDTLLNSLYLPKGTHTVHLQFLDSAGLWSSVITDTFDRVAVPIAGFSVNDSTICLSTQVSFTNNSKESNKYKWYFGDGDSSSNINPNHIYSSSGTYTVTLLAEDTISGLINTLIKQSYIIVYSNPLAIVGNNKSICKRTSASIGSSTVNGNTYSWTSSPSGFTSASANPTVSPNSTTKYYLMETVSATGCYKSDSITVTIKQSSASSLTKTSCNSYTFNSKPLTTSGIYYDTLTNTVGCDSIITLDLTINKGNSNTLTTTACNTYSFKGSQITNSGTYYDTLTNAAGCDSIITLNLTIIKTKIDTIYQTNVLCNGDSSGSINITASGGSAPYSYSLNGTAYQSNNIYNNLSAGNYTIIAKDSNGCSDTKSITLTEPSKLNFNTSHTNVLCNGDSIGSITVSASGGVGNYMYKLGSSNYQTSNTFSNLQAGTYTIYSKDSNNCEKSSQVVITQPSALSYATKINPVKCYGDSNGSIIITPSGGTAPYLYKFGNGNYQSQNSFSNLVVGNYTITIKDSNNCIIAFGFNISQPAVLKIMNYPTPSSGIMCYGDSTGEAVVTVTGGTQPYQYKLGGGNYQYSNYFDNLKAGWHTITVKDSNGCTDTNSIYINQLPQVKINTYATSPICYGDSSGTITVTPSLGRNPYQFKIGNGSYQSLNKFIKLSGGSYIITVRDANGCVSKSAVTITQPSPISAGLTLHNVLCKGDSSGSVDISAIGGNGPYLYKLGNGIFQGNPTFGSLKVGNYILYIKDSTNCLSTLYFNITEPSNVLLFNTNTSYANCAGNSGSIRVNVSGGTPPYMYKIGNGNYQNSDKFDSLSSGNYIISVKDSNGCVSTNTVNLPANNILLAMSISKTNICCDGTATGGLQINVSGGTSPYMYQLGNANYQSNNIYNNLQKGVYTITAKDSNNCTVSSQVSLYEPAQMQASIVWTGATDSLWKNAANWSPARVPNSFDSINIPTGLSRYPTIDLAQSTNSIRIDSGAYIRMLSSGKLSIYGVFSQSGTLYADGGVLFLNNNSGLPAGNYHGINFNGKIKLCGNITMKHVLAMGTGNSIDNRGYNLTTNGDIANSGTFFGKGKLILTRDFGTQSIQGVATYSNIELNNPNNFGARILTDIYITDTLKLTQGTLVIYPNTTLTVGTNNTSNGYIYTANGILVSGNSQPSHLTLLGNSQSGAISNLKLQILGTFKANRPNGIILGANTQFAGLDLQSGKLEMNGYNLVLGRAGINLSVSTSGYINNKSTFGNLQVIGGINSPTITGLKIDTVNQVNFERTSGITLGKNIYVRSVANVGSGWVDLSGYNISLSATANVSEQANGAKFKGDSGVLTTQRNYTSALANTNIAGLGLKLSTTKAMGVTTFSRGHKVWQNANGKSIRRYYKLEPTVYQNNTSSFLFNYDTTELVSGTAHYTLWTNNSVNNGGSWSTYNNTTRSGLAAISYLANNNINLAASIIITASDSSNKPLFPLGFADVETSNIIVYPNPTTGNLYINFGSENYIYNITLSDISGKQLLYMKNQTKNSHIVLDENIGAGIYILRVFDGKEYKQFKVCRVKY